MDACLLVPIVVLVIGFISLLSAGGYYRFTSSYSNSYVRTALTRRGEPLTMFRVVIALLLDRSLAALLIYRVNYRLNNRALGRLITNVAHALTGVEIYFNAKIGYRVQIWHGQGTVIGQNAIVGDDCLLLHQVTLGSGFVRLGKGVKVGVGAKILGSISIGDCSVIGANAVVTTDLPVRSLVTMQVNVQTLRDGASVEFGTK